VSAGAFTLRESIRAVGALTGREWIRFGRQPSRIVAAVGAAALLWFFLAGGFADALRPGAADGAEGDPAYTTYLVPGMATLVVLFASIFAAMSLIEDRREGLLQTALASPAPRWTIAASKAVGGAGAGLAQGAVILLAAPALGQRITASGFLSAFAALALASLALTSLGLALAWRIDSSEGFHGVMSGLLMPMWLLSGAMFRAEDAAPWLAPVVRINPLHWATEAVRTGLRGAPELWPFLGAGAFAATAGALAVGSLGGRR